MEMPGSGSEKLVEFPTGVSNRNICAYKQQMPHGMHRTQVWGINLAQLAPSVDMNLRAIFRRPMYACMDFYGAYSYSGLVRQASRFITVSVSA